MKETRTGSPAVKMTMLLVAVLFALGSLSPALDLSDGAVADPTVVGSNSSFVAVWDFSEPGEYVTADASVEGGGARLGFETANLTDDYSSSGTSGVFNQVTAGMYEGNLSLGFYGTRNPTVHNVTSAFKTTTNVTGFVEFNDAVDLLLDQDEYLEISDFESYDHLGTMSYVNLSIVVNSNNGGAAVAVQINTGGGWSGDLNTSWVNIADTTYWVSLDASGVDTRSELNDLQVRVYCRDPSGDGGIPERTWVDQVCLWSDYIHPVDLSYSNSGSYTSPVLDTPEGGFHFWDNVSWNATSTGPGTAVEVQVHTGPTPQVDANWGPWTVYMTDPSGNSLGGVTDTYVQYRARLSTTNTSNTPLLDNVTLTYHKYSDTGSVETPDLAVGNLVSWNWVTSNETLNGGVVNYFFSTDSGLSWTNLENHLGGMNTIPTGSGKVRFMAELTAGSHLTSPELHNITIGYTVLYLPQIQVTLATSGGTARPGDTVILDVSIDNAGNAPALSSLLTLHNPTEMSYKGSSIPGTPSGPPDALVWDLGQLDPGLYTYAINLKVLGGFPNGTIVECGAKVSYRNHLGNLMPAATSDDLAWTLFAPELAASLEVDSMTAGPGETLNYTFSLENTGKAKALEVSAYTDLPAGLAFVSATPGPANTAGQRVSWDLEDPLGGGDSWSVRMEAVPGDGVEDGQQLQVTFRVNYTDGNNTVFPPLASDKATTTVEVPEIPVEQDPWIGGDIPDVVMEEDSGPLTLNLTGFENDLQDGGKKLQWYVTGEAPSLYHLSGENSTEDNLVFTPLENAWGTDEVTLHLSDSDGNVASRALTVDITPVNDPPIIGAVPDLNVHYGELYGFDLGYYVSDVEVPAPELIIAPSDTSRITMNGTLMEMLYPHSASGKAFTVELTVSDGELSDSASFMVTVSDNYAPVKYGPPLPQVNMTDSQVITGAFVLEEYFMDPDGDALGYIAFGHSHINVTVNPNSMVDLTAPPGWSGAELVGFRALDGKGGMAEAYSLVTVTAVNDAPVVSGVPDLQVHPDFPYSLDIGPYVTDPDSASDTLSVGTNRTDMEGALGPGGLWLVIDAPASLLGMNVSLEVIVSDGLASGTDDMIISVTSNIPPELAIPVPDVTFDEDTVMENVFNLGDHFLDPDSGQEMYFYYAGRTHVQAWVDDGLNASFRADPDWFGAEEVIVRAVDSEGALKEDAFMVTVRPVNDAPVLEPIPLQEGEEGEVWGLDLRDYCRDVDDDFDSLSFSVDTEYVFLEDGFLMFSASKNTPEAFYLNVTDGDLMVSVVVNVTVEKDSRSGGGDGGDGGLLGDGGGFSVLFHETTQFVRDYSYAILAIITAVFLALLVFVYTTVYEVEEVFLIHRDKGVVIHYLSHLEEATFEKEILGSMLTTFQTFVEDAFVIDRIGRRRRSKSEEDLRMTQFSIGNDQNVMIEVGDNLYMALIYKGAESRLRMKLRRILRRLEARYSDTLTNWDGDMEGLDGSEEMICGLLTTPISKDAIWKGRRVEPEADDEDDGPDSLRDEKLFFDMRDDKASLLDLLREDGIDVPDDWELPEDQVDGKKKAPAGDDPKGGEDLEGGEAPKGGENTYGKEETGGPAGGEGKDDSGDPDGGEGTEDRTEAVVVHEQTDEAEEWEDEIMLLPPAGRGGDGQ